MNLLANVQGITICRINGSLPLSQQLQKFHTLSCLERQREGGRDCIRLGISFRVAGSSMETWKTGWTPWNVSRSRRIQEWDPDCAKISNGSKYLLDNLCDGQLIWKNFPLTKACFPTENSRGRIRWASGEGVHSMEIWRKSWRYQKGVGWVED